MSTPADAQGSNPFSTRFIRPGATPFLFMNGEAAEQLVHKLAEQNWRGQIVGPHGSGKSTLLATLEQPLRAVGRCRWQVALHDGQRTMPRGWLREAVEQRANLIIVDGYEQLAYYRRLALKLTCRLRGWGLLVTAHADVGLPTIYQTASDLTLAEQVVEHLLSGAVVRLSPEQVATAYQQTGGDLRETLFRLYDVWEAQSRSTR